ncbi:MAG: hypothetical protein K9I84_05590 [Leadbetterella sp.]|nr:hypothetical protein [Leadbetterella sp.]
MNNIDVTPIEIRDFAISHGWSLIKEAIKDGLYVLNSPNNDFRQLIFPTDNTTDQFDSLAETTLTKIAQFLNKTTFKTLEEIREINDDVISLRYYSENKIVNSLSFQEALESIEATKQMILSAGSSVVNPSLFHKRMSRIEATEILKMTRFRHTEEGSFILKVSCPIHLEGSPLLSLFGEEEVQKPVSRKAFELINNGANKILESIETDSLSELFIDQKESSHPIISYNLCDAISNLFDDERELPFELNFNWSRAYLGTLGQPSFPKTIRFPYALKPKLDDLKSYFRPEAKETANTFFGTVESLNGNVGDDGRRSGEVSLRLIIEGEMITAKANLDSDIYETAYQAHGIEGGGLTKIKAILRPGARMNSLSNITSFEIVSKE